MTLLHTLYPPAFGSVGAVFEVGAVLGTVGLAVLVRQRSTFGWTCAAAALVVAAHAIFWVRIAPVNATLGAVAPDALPPDWETLRRHWEWSHATRAVLQIVALAALVWSVVLETPPAR